MVLHQQRIVRRWSNVIDLAACGEQIRNCDNPDRAKNWNWEEKKKVEREENVKTCHMGCERGRSLFINDFCQ